MTSDNRCEVIPPLRKKQCYRTAVRLDRWIPSLPLMALKTKCSLHTRMWLNMHRRAIRKPAAARYTPFVFLLACRLGRSQREDICHRNDNEAEAWETLFRRNLTNRRKKRSVGPSWGFILACLVLLAPHPPTHPPLPPQAQRGLSLHLSLSLLSGLSGSLINQQAALFTSVTLSAQLCRSVTPHRGPWFAGLLIPGVGYNSSLPPSFPHYCSMPLTVLLSLLLHLLFSCNLIVFLVLDLICRSVCIRYLICPFIKLIIFRWKFCLSELPSAIYNKDRK